MRFQGSGGAGITIKDMNDQTFGTKTKKSSKQCSQNLERREKKRYRLFLSRFGAIINNQTEQLEHFLDDNKQTEKITKKMQQKLL